MKAPEENMDEKLNRLLGQIGDPDPDQMDYRIGSVARSLQPIALESQQLADTAGESLRQVRRPRRTPMIAVAAAIAAILVVAFSATFWRAEEIRPIAKSAERNADPPGRPPANRDKASVTTLADGSRVEMRSGSEVTVEPVLDGLRIRLKTGSIIVNAAKQAPSRHLYVQTRDVIVSVVGTVFLVDADDRGSRVAVIEGAVHVQQGTVGKNLQPGEQVSSSKEMEDIALQVQIGWSREAAAYLSLLHDALAKKVAARQSSPRPPAITDMPRFEEASIRPCPQEFRAPEGMRGGGSNSIRLSPGRLDALCMTPATLIRTAYRELENNPHIGNGSRLFFDSTYGLGVENGTRVRGGPDWVRSEKYTIAAVAEGRMDAPTIGGPMLLALLENRFRLKAHVESEEIPVWALKVAKDGLKIEPVPEGCFQPPRFASPPDEAEIHRLEEARGTKPFCRVTMEPFPPNLKFTVVGSLTRLASLISSSSSLEEPLRSLSTSLDGLMVLNKTGIPDTETFDLVLEFGADPTAWTEMQQLGFLPAQFTDPLGPTIFEALGKLGLTLERTKGSREFIVIDQIERPSPN